MNKNLRHYLWEFKGQNCLLVVILFFNALLITLNGLGSANALTALVAGKFTAFICWVIVMTGSYALFCFGLFLQQYQYSRCCQLMNTAIRRDVTVRLSNTTYETYHSQSSSVYSSWLTNDVTTIDQMGFYNVMDIVTQVFSVAFAAIALATFHYILLLTTLVLAVVMYLVPKVFTKPVQRRSLAMTHANERLMNRISDVLTGFDALNLLNLRKLLVQRTVAASQDAATHINAWQWLNGRHLGRDQRCERLVSKYHAAAYRLHGLAAPGPHRHHQRQFKLCRHDFCRDDRHHDFHHGYGVGHPNL
ncbi:ABC transporter transmembrane domain-containing protein [Schleiferilactobacillus harbinensis]|uniref:ABC transporter transmembrane domain-containing protein n=1 Tax=Schleiferilactobacillus harbinensis TaxID=304207 RepID=UPI001171647C|nr:ABC transporter transmembrane domain-containing protein [Schleiferilactobacillus harbinensis]GEK06199.1 hypothetical protein LHA01_14380 [Schleiferilactobacillus harbinensis]